MKTGIKNDSDKGVDYSLIPPNAIEALAKVLTFGAIKYDRENWKLVEDSKNRYFAALQRHLWAVRKGEVNDPETGLSHFAHALANCVFLYEIYEQEKE